MNKFKKLLIIFLVPLFTTLFHASIDLIYYNFFIDMPLNLNTFLFFFPWVRYGITYCLCVVTALLVTLFMEDENDYDVFA